MTTQDTLTRHVNIVDSIKNELIRYKNINNKKPTVKTFKIGINLQEVLMYSPIYCDGKLNIYGIIFDVSDPDWTIPSDEYILTLE